MYISELKFGSQREPQRLKNVLVPFWLEERQQLRLEPHGQAHALRAVGSQMLALIHETGSQMKQPSQRGFLGSSATIPRAVEKGT